MEFNVKLERFEGPYTKLLELIQDHKLSITEVSLASIADEYIAYVRKLQEEEKNLRTSIDISQFVLVASTLMLIKARSLLPGIAFTQEEEKQVTQLEKKLELYKKLQEAGTKIRSIYQKNSLYSKDRSVPKGIKIFIPPTGTTTASLHSIALLTLSLFKPIERLKDIYVEQAIRIETVIDSLLERVQRAPSFSLSSVAGDGQTFAEKKKLLIVTFIALLELVRSGSLEARQEGSGEILISKS
ncbi:MAG: segregation and condensation protein [Patescibacteria group bacterium]|nr:segregation and condensation protein [Patescibacteria group bacterium]